ncbi:hypothetical protein LSH36_356g03025 [Paralvinella palmiformis]|uniref:Uncharacterized protein n=1 Tax=Paralvinella palmiformis TaxID=53620 RepID=A0AAD9JER8_9ANNE|nr:hypothetical protein LSH36_356g03025 [Paralvinella palmiformis]
METIAKTLIRSTLRQRINVLWGLSKHVNFSSSNQSSLNLSGIYPPIATPFNEDETIAYDKLQENMDRWNKIPLKGFVVQGSNGEYAFLDVDERIEMVKRVSEMAARDKLIIAGSGCESTRDTINMSKKMASVGAKAVLVVTPCYYKGRMTNEALERHYTKTKNEDFQIIAGSAGFLYPALAVGAVGGICAFANILGAECCRLHDLFKAGKHEEAKVLQHRMIMPNAGVTRVFGVSGLKAAMSWFGYYGGPVRSPLQLLNSEESLKLRQTFVASKLLDN